MNRADALAAAGTAPAPIVLEPNPLSYVQVTGQGSESHPAAPEPVAALRAKMPAAVPTIAPGEGTV